jgi:hypothetical protein
VTYAHWGAVFPLGGDELADCLALWAGPEPLFAAEVGDWVDADCSANNVLTVCEGPAALQGCEELPGLPGRYLCALGLGWLASAEGCGLAGGRLLRPTSDADNAAVVQALAGGGLVWLGASDKQREGEWFWDDGQRVGATFVAFGEGEPNDEFGREDCLAMNTTAWNDSRCGGSKHYLCDDLTMSLVDCTPLQSLTSPSRFLCTQGRNHDNANARCLAGGGHLARFDSYTTWTATLEALAVVAPDFGELWIDGTDVDVEGVWRRSDGVVITDVR